MDFQGIHLKLVDILEDRKCRIIQSSLAKHPWCDGNLRDCSGMFLAFGFLNKLLSVFAHQLNEFNSSTDPR